MALVLADRVLQTGTANTTVSFNLTTAVSGYQSFAVIGNGNTTYYGAWDGTNWEVGIGTYSTSGPILTRTTIIVSSNSNAAVSTFGSVISIFVTQPAEKAVYLDASGNASALGTISSGTWNATTIGTAYGGTGLGGSTPYTSSGILYASSASALTTSSSFKYDTYGNLLVSASSSAYAGLIGMQLNTVAGTTSSSVPAYINGISSSTSGIPSFVGNWQSAGWWGIGSDTSSSDLTVRLGQVTLGTSGSSWQGTYANLKIANLTGAQGTFSGSGLFTGLGSSSNPNGGLVGGPSVGSGNSNGKLIYLYNDGGTNIKLDAYNYNTSAALSFSIGGNGGNVSVNTASNLGYNLGVNGTLYSSSLATLNSISVGAGSTAGVANNILINSVTVPQVVLNSTGTYYANIGNPSSQVWQLGYSGNSTSNGVAVLTWAPNGHVNINNGTSDFGYALGVNGSIFANGSIALNNSSGGDIISTNGTVTVRMGIGSYLGTGLATVSVGGANPLIFVINSAEKMRIDSSGSIGQGTTPNAWVTPAIQCAYGGSFWNNVDNSLHITENAFYNGSWNYISGSSAAATNYYQAGGTHNWRYAAAGTGTVSWSLAMFIDTVGNLLVGTSTAYGSGGCLSGSYSSFGTGTVNPKAVNWGQYSTNNGVPQYTGNWVSSYSWGIGPHSSANDSILRIGTISLSGSGVSWNGNYVNIYAGAYTNASDYRIKENVANVSDGILAKILALRVINYNVIRHPDEDGEMPPIKDEVGFIAHEIQEQFPILVSGKKDAVSGAGVPEHQGVDYAKLTAYLTKAIQELSAQVTALQAKVG
jgi:hypothetical protein